MVVVNREERRDMYQWLMNIIERREGEGDRRTNTTQLQRGRL